MVEIMFIEQIFPGVVADKSTLIERLFAEGKTRGFSLEDTKAILSIVPKTIMESGAFLDKMTNLWRYEFGVPYEIAENFVWGTHMWVPVESLFTALFCACTLLFENKCATYLKQLADPTKHQDKLVEMIPADKVGCTAKLEFEVSGMGAGNSTVDWVIRSQDDRTVLVDVKRRTIDFIRQAQKIETHAGNTAPEPHHDPAMLFRSVEHKFLAAEPEVQLQGVWIVTDIKQEEKEFNRAFTALDTRKVHFAILGNWKPDVHILAQPHVDREYLLNLFNVEASTRFTFRRAFQDQG